MSTGAPGEEARIAIIIDDLGNRLDHGERVVRLPGAVTPSFLPRTPYAARLAREAYASGKEVMLHVPMGCLCTKPLGPGGLTEWMTREQFVATLRENIAAVPYVRGINNHMGSYITTDSLRMGWLMTALRSYPGFYFVDSRTTPETVARTVAVSYGVPSSRRDVFLDNEDDSPAIARQFDKLLKLAHRRGSAIAIAHPRTATLALLEARLPQLAARGITLAPVSEIIATQTKQRVPQWQASLSPSPKAAKNSKQ